MRSNAIPLVIISFLISGCSSIDKDYIEQRVQNEVNKCKGEVKSFTLIKEGLFSNKYTGYAEVKIRNKTFYPDIDAVADSDTYYWKNQDACNLEEADRKAKEFERKMSRW